MAANSHRESAAGGFAPLAVCLYLLTSALPLQANLPLLLLAIFGSLAAWKGPGLSGAGPRKLWLPLVFFLSSTLLTAAVSVDPVRSFSLSAAVVPALAIYLLIAGCPVRSEWTERLLAVLLLVGVGLSVAVAVVLARQGWQVPAGFENWIAQAGSPLLVVANDLAYLALLTPLAVALAMRGGWWRMALAGASLLSAVLMAGLVQSRQVAALLVLMLFGMALLLKPRWAVPAMGAAVVVIMLLDAARGWPLTARFALLWGTGEAGHSGMTGLWDARLPIWSHAWQTFLQHPLMGQGPHTFSYTSVDGIQVSWAHNLYLETLAEQGILGLAALLTLLGGMLWVAVEQWRRASREDAPLAASLLCVTLGIALGGLVEFTFLREWLTVLLFTIAGLLARERILQ